MTPAPCSRTNRISVLVPNIEKRPRFMDSRRKNSFSIEIADCGARYAKFLAHISQGPMSSTHCGLVTPFGGRDLGQHWLS